MLLGRSASDYDVATDAQPGDVMKLFRRTLKVGAKFGVVIVLVEDQLVSAKAEAEAELVSAKARRAGAGQIEVATFRAEADYANGRHPETIKFASAVEDASRRDFTINGMFYDPIEEKVIDYVGGQKDLKKQIIRTIGEPQERFSEDYLRTLRAVRFSTQLGFRIEPKTWSAVCSNAKKITKISGERIAIELEGIFVNPNRSAGASMLIESGLAEAIFPGFAGRQAKFAIKVLSQLRKKVDFALVLACFFAGRETEYAIEKCQILKLSRSQNKHIKFLLSNRGKLLDDQMSLAQLKLIASEAYFRDLYELQRAIQKASDGRKSIAPLIKLRKRIKALGDIELRPKPLLNGHDLIRLGAVPGPSLGQLTEEMYIAQLEGTLQTAKQARQWAQDWLQKHKRTDN